MKFLDVQAADGVIRMAKIVKGADHFGESIPEETAFALMDRYVALGGNSIDVARIYGKIRCGDMEGAYAHSEGVVGRWMKARGNRGKIVLITKGAHHNMNHPAEKRVTPECIRSDLETSLKELGVGHVDIYFLHRDDPTKPVGPIIDCLDELVKAGKIRAAGASNWTAARIDEANAYAKAHGKTPFTVSQVQWSIARTTPELWGDPSLVTMNEAEYAAYQKNQIPVMAYASQSAGYFSKLSAGQELKPRVALRFDSPENRERFERVMALCARTGKTAAQISLAYILSNPLPAAAIVGCSTVEQLEDSMAGMDFALDAKTCMELVE